MAGKSVPSAVEKVFRVNELLEAVLVHLSGGDILYNAQRVNQTWESCIQTSKPLQEACWIRPVPIAEDTDPLFLPLNSLFEIGQATTDLFLGLQQELGGHVATPRQIAKILADGKIDIYAYWFVCDMRPISQATHEQVAENERDRQRIAENCPVKPMQKRLYDHLDRNHLNPILNSFNHVSHFWTGYGDHVILAIDEEEMLHHRLVATFMEAMVFLLQTEPLEAGWRGTYITRPACTKITVTGRKFAQPNLLQSFECDMGITVEALFRVVVAFSEDYLAWASGPAMAHLNLEEYIGDIDRICCALDEYVVRDLLRERT